MALGRQTLDTWGAVPNLNKFPFHIEWSLASWMMNGVDAALLMLCPLALRVIVQERALRFSIGHCPSCVYPLPDVTTRDQIFQAFPLCVVCLPIGLIPGTVPSSVFDRLWHANTKLPGNWKSYIRIVSKFRKFMYRILYTEANNCPVLQIGPGPSFPSQSCYTYDCPWSSMALDVEVVIFTASFTLQHKWLEVIGFFTCSSCSQKHTAVAISCSH